MAKRVKTHGLEINYDVDYRDVKYPRLEFKTGNLLLVLPKNYKNEVAILEKHKKWLRKKQFIIKTALEEAKKRSLNLNRTNEELKHFVQSVARNFQEEFNFKINNIYFRKMNSKWGSYSSKRNLTINTLLKYLPENLINYVIFHEMAHTWERKHNERFWNIIGKKFKEYQAREKDLLVYWFLVQQMSTNPRGLPE